ncbi:hypothetical protein I7I51_00826 [Histoplasma capsulatum]|uniref:Uncharacterized protein n=1 Tax=Ajellomyces capsulatus TaxID=5037 RepID=A0A8A1MBA1_AJECA|nr:hypothetical protein I7I51_00826 [Histoplasma capsulatum]
MEQVAELLFGNGFFVDLCNTFSPRMQRFAINLQRSYISNRRYAGLDIKISRYYDDKFSAPDFWLRLRCGVALALSTIPRYRDGNRERTPTLDPANVSSCL